MDDSESIRKCQKSIFYMLIDNKMLTERKRRNSWLRKMAERNIQPEPSALTASMWKHGCSCFQPEDH